MLDEIARDLRKNFDAKLVDELLAAYDETKRNFYLGGLRLSEVEGGRFCEAAFRMLEQKITGKFTPLGKQVDSERVIKETQQTQLPDGVRIHIPRALRMVYDIRNKRDAAHLDWILAEFIRVLSWRFCGPSSENHQRSRKKTDPRSSRF